MFFINTDINNYCNSKQFLYKDYKSKDYLILNSTSMYKDAIPIIKKYKNIIAYLDNDQPGKDCFKKIKKEAPWIVDFSHTFLPCKDLNEYLIQKVRHVL